MTRHLTFAHHPGMGELLEVNFIESHDGRAYTARRDSSEDPVRCSAGRGLPSRSRRVSAGGSQVHDIAGGFDAGHHARDRNADPACNTEAPPDAGDRRIPRQAPARPGVGQMWGRPASVLGDDARVARRSARVQPHGLQRPRLLRQVAVRPQNLRRHRDGGRAGRGSPTRLESRSRMRALESLLMSEITAPEGSNASRPYPFGAGSPRGGAA